MNEPKLDSEELSRQPDFHNKFIIFIPNVNNVAVDTTLVR